MNFNFNSRQIPAPALTGKRSMRPIPSKSFSPKTARISRCGVLMRAAASEIGGQHAANLESAVNVANPPAAGPS